MTSPQVKDDDTEVAKPPALVLSKPFSDATAPIDDQRNASFPNLSNEVTPAAQGNCTENHEGESKVEVDQSQSVPLPERRSIKSKLSTVRSLQIPTLESFRDNDGHPTQTALRLRKVRAVLLKYTKFIGPGFMVSVAYIDPGNYATDVSAGASFRFKLLFMVLLSNIFAIFLQSLCIKLGSVTGMNLAENCKAHLPKWLNYVLYFFAESAIIATDIAEVIGTAIALNLLFKLPLVAGCAISIVDVMFILFFYNPNGSMRGLRVFECGVALLVIGVVVCFCFQLSLITGTSAGEVFKGYLPSSALVRSDGLFQAAGILGATVMPHSLYLGSGIIQSRLREFDVKHGNAEPPKPESERTEDDEPYRPSLSAIRSCLKYSIVELGTSLFTFALFVNSAILIVAGASLSHKEGASDADLFGIHTLLSQSLAPAAGTIFALALLLSGISAGIVCTIAGQMVSEGSLNWKMKPWIRRLMTRSISITPSIIIAGSVGRQGLSAALQGSQVALSVILPFVSAPLIYFTCLNRFMTVRSTDGESASGVKMRNNLLTAICAVVLWLIIVVINGALIILLILGKD
ncbi:MAG: hypothetical protein M1820_009762 [Bogoriella megaspora]|nr:MAG: hypothetical protein M1820_009762 [Bogoriella megaspora]